MNISRKKLIAQRREATIYVQQLVQYKDSAVGLVFMESAVELAMETSRVKSVVRNQARAKLNQLEHDEPAEMITTSCNRYSRSKKKKNRKLKLELELERRRSAGSVDDISSDVIIQQKLQWNGSAESFYQQLAFGVGNCKTMSLK
ncbi:hypothetical protein F511_45363 [Dorcoceras hygrometricum]|uniref:Uncharacterized protein n=1 Tax=Dorcoceras hygrometricum TaxID=472368 RepID=A0A2Z7A3E8_9LAMI|nr:hypothetical protein F511_45363 [Dorcoceras hygrometricum]